MNDKLAPTRPVALPQKRQIDKICDAFEWAYRQGGSPDLESYADRAEPAARPQLLCELVEIELHYRNARGEPIDRESLLAKYPCLQQELQGLVDALEETGREKHQPQSSWQGNSGRQDRGAARGLHVRCPHCHNPIELVVDTPLEEIQCPSCGSSFSLVSDAQSTREASALSHLGQFELVERVGMGTFGTVWKARDMVLDRTVAIKIPRAGQLSAEETEKFIREARTVAQLRHSNIVSVHEVGRGDGSLFIVSDFVRGVPLSDILADHRVARQEAVVLSIKIADALEHAHEAGVIHRDLKPSNIMIDDAGEPHLMDFGLAKRDVGEATVTLDGTILGTPAYMSPEQARGEGHKVNRRTDIYSLGVLLFQMLTGELPFRGTTRMLLHKVINEDAPSPRRLDLTIPKDLETICLKCVQKEPAKRYDSAKDVAKDLDRFLKNEPISARPMGQTEKLWRWCRRQPMVAGLAGTLALVLVVFAVAASATAVHQASQANKLNTALSNERQLTHEAVAAQQEATRARKQAEVATADAYTSAGLIEAERSNFAVAALWFANATLIAKNVNDPQREAANRVRFNLWSQLAPTPRAAFVVSPKEFMMHPGGGSLLVTTGSGDCQLVDVQTQGISAEWTDHFPAAAAAWRADGKWIAVASLDGRIHVLEFPSRQVIQVIVEVDGMTRQVAFSGDGGRLAISFGRTARVWDFSERRFITSALPHPAQIGHVVLDHKGERLVTTCRDGKARLFAVHTGSTSASPQFAPVEHDFDQRPVFVADDSQIVFTMRQNDELNRQSKAELRDADTGRIERRIQLNQWSVARHVAACPDGRYFVIADEFAVTLYDAQNGQPTGRHIRHTNHVYKCVFSGDGSILMTVSADRQVMFHSMPDFSEVLPALPHLDEVVAGAFSADGQTFATLQADGLLRVWSMPHGIKPHIVPEQHLARLSRDGELFIWADWPLNRDLTFTEVYETKTGKRVSAQLRSRGLLNDAVLSPDRTKVITLCSLEEHDDQMAWPQIKWANQQGWVQVWDWAKGEELRPPLKTPSEPIGVDWHPDGKLVVVLCAAGEIVIIDSEAWKVIASRWHGGAAPPGQLAHRRVWFTPDGTYFATGGADSVVKLWLTQNATLQATLRHGSMCRDVDVSADGKLAATASTDKTARVWNLETGEAVSRPLEHPDWVFSSRFSSNGRLLLTSCRDGTARLWDWRDGELVCPPFRHDDEVFHAIYTPDKKWIITASRDGSARIWDPLTGKPVTPPLKTGQWLHSIAVTPDGRYAVVSGHCAAVINIGALTAVNTPSSDGETARVLGEILAGRRIHKGGGVVNLTSFEWYERWRSMQRGDIIDLRGQPAHEEHLEPLLGVSPFR